MATSTKWRINVSLTNGGFWGLMEVQFRPVAGVDTPLTGLTGTASASSSYTGYSPANAADGIIDGSHEWFAADTETTGWWQYEFATPIDVAEYAFAIDDWAYSPRNWTLEYWDGSAWVVADTVTDADYLWYYHYYTLVAFKTGANGAPTVAPGGDATAKKKWKFEFTSNNDGDLLGIGEIQLRTTAGADAALSGGTASASYPYSVDYGPAMAADGTVHVSSMWYAGSTSGWWAYEFASATDVVEYTITPMDAAEAPKDWTLSYWDGSAWVVADTQSNVTAWSDAAASTFSVSAPDETGNNTLTGSIPLLTLLLDASTPFNLGDINLGNPQNLDSTYTATPFTLIGRTLPPSAAIAGSIDLGSLGGYGLGGVVPIDYLNDYLNTPYQLDASLASGAVGSGTLALPLLSVLGVDNTMTLPALSLEASAVAGATATASLPLARLSVAGVLADPVLLPALSLDAVAQSGATGAAQVSLAGLDAAGAVLIGTASDASLAWPALQADGNTGVHGDVAWPGALVQAAGLTGRAGEAVLTWPKATLAASATARQLPATGAATFAPLDAAGILARGTLLQGDVTLAPALLSAAGVTDALASGALLLPAYTGAAAGVTGALADAALALPVLRTAGTASASPNDNDGAGAAAFSAPTLAGRALPGALGTGEATLAAASLSGAAYFDTDAAGAVALLPVLLTARADNVAAQVGDGAARLLPATVAALAVAGTQAAGDARLAGIALGAAGLTELLGTASVRLGAPTVTGAATVTAAPAAPVEADGAATLRTPLVAAQGVTGTMAGGAALLAAWTAAGAGMADGAATGAATLLPALLTATALSSNTAVGTLALLPPDARAAGQAGRVGTVALTVPLLQVGATGFADVLGEATVLLPALSLEAGGMAGVVAPVWTGVALNTHSRAASTYDGLAINSLAHFNGLVLAATPTGIVALTGETDGGAPIAARATGPTSDLGSEQVKRVLAGYLGVRTGGTLELTLVTDEHHDYAYAVTAPAAGTLGTTRVKCGRGVEGRYWQWTLSNRAGADFTLDALSLDVQALSKRIG